MMMDERQNSIASKSNGVRWYQSRNWRFLLLNIIFILVSFRPVLDLLQTSFHSDYDSFIPFIPLIVIYLMYSDRQRIFSRITSPSALGLSTIVIGILLLVATHHFMPLLDNRDYLAIRIFSLVILWIGGFSFCYGNNTARAAVFPLMFLLFTVPMPGAALERIILFLQTGSAETAYGFLKLADISVVRDGFIFHLPTLDIEVAKQCSGIRSSLALVITGTLAGYFFLRTGWTRALLMISIVPIAVLKNGFRIASLALLGVYVDERILQSDLHTKGGFIFFILALVLVLSVIMLLRKAEGKFALKANQEDLKNSNC